VILVAMPERFGLPGVPSDRRECDRCGAGVWVSRRARSEAAPSIDGIICVVCAMAVVKPGDTLEPAPWVAADLADALGDKLP
jgi:hypothetical protein